MTRFHSHLRPRGKVRMSSATMLSNWSETLCALACAELASCEKSVCIRVHLLLQFTQMKILIIEDELSIRRGLIDLLGDAGHEVEAFEDGALGLNAGTQRSFDLVILDLMLPKMPGLEVCRRLREVRPGLPILMLTALASEKDVVHGLNTGADDYITKPFSPKELLARVNAMARRIRRLGEEQDVIRVDGCEINLDQCLVRRGEAMIPLTAREVGILRWLHLQRGRVVTREELLEEVWGMSSGLKTRTVDVTILYLRRKIERKPGHPRIVLSVKGLGYQWAAMNTQREEAKT